MLFVRSVASVNVAIDASAPSTTALTAESANESSRNEKVLADTFSSLNIAIQGVANGEMLVMMSETSSFLPTWLYVVYVLI